MQHIPEESIEFILDHPELSGMEIYRAGYASSPRTARRWKKRLFNEYEVEQRVSSQKMDEWEEDDSEFDLDAFLEWAPHQVQQSYKLDPIITHDIMDFKTNDPVAVIFPSCMHLGGRFTAYEEFRNIFYRILDMPRIYWGSLGDDIEGFIEQFRDVKAISDQLLPVNRQYEILKAVLKRLDDKNKLLFGVGSQHGGDWTLRRTGNNPVKDIYLSFGRPFFDGRGYVKFNVGKQVYNVAFAHQFKGHSIYNPNHAQTRALLFDYPNADVVLMGDKHKPSVQQFAIFGDEVEAGNRPSPMVTLVMSGTAKTGPDPYTIRGWSKGVLGWPILIFMPDKHEIKFTWDLEDVEMWL